MANAICLIKIVLITIFLVVLMYDRIAREWYKGYVSKHKINHLPFPIVGSC
jgi:hypothetical protein